VMCDSLQRLRNLVREGKLEITQILSPPRSMSTILEIALAQSADAQVHEPFRVMAGKKDVVQACDTILAKVRELSRTNTGPHRIVVKDIAEFTPLEWQAWMPLVQHFVFIVREPLLQTHSLMQVSARYALSRHLPRQIAKTVWRALRAGCPTSLVGLAEQQAHNLLHPVFGCRARPDAEQMRRALPAIQQSVFTLNDNSYRILISTMNAVEEHVRTLPTKTLVVLEGLGLKMAPARTLERITTTFGWSGTPATPWTEGVGNRFYDRYPIGGVDENGVTNSLWHRRAALSHRIDPIDPQQDAPPTLRWFPALLQDQICRQGLPTYMRILMHPKVVSLPTAEELVAPLSGITSGARLEDINPVATYATAATLKKRNLESRRLRVLDDLQSRLRESYGERFELAFDVIDATVEGGHDGRRPAPLRGR
jgi:hypothetical protein